MKRPVMLFLSVLLIIVLSACAIDSQNDKPVVLTTLFPQYDIARALAGDLIDLQLLLPAGADAHTFEPTPRKVVEILDADLLLYSGDAMEPWVASLITPAQHRRLRVLDLSRNIALIGFQAGLTIPENDHGHDHENEIGAFELIHRQEGGTKVAYVHGPHWHGQLPGVEVDTHLSIGAHIVSADGRERELDSAAEVNGVTVSLAPNAPEGLVELTHYGDHVHIRGLQEGQTQVVFHWMHHGEIRYTTPPIAVTVGEHHDHDHDHDDEMGAFELLHRQAGGNKIAYVHGAHWHGGLPSINVSQYLSIGAFIMSADGQARVLDSDGEVNGVTVSLAPGAQTGIVELTIHGDHVHIRGLQDGQTQVVFHWVHRGEVRFTTPALSIVVGEADTYEGPFDPHIWTDPLNVAIMVLEVRDALIQLLPEHEMRIRLNALAYLNELDALHEGFEDLRANTRLNTVMYGGHNVMGYFMQRYQLTYVNPYRGFSTDAEPTPQALATMIELMHTYSINYLFSEKMIAPHVAQAIAQETGAQILYLYAMENIPSDDYASGMTLIDMMRHNLEQLRIGLEYYVHD